MIFFKKKPKIEFYSVNWEQTYNYPIELMDTVNSPWFSEVKEIISKNKNNPNAVNSSSYMCSGIREIMNFGFVLRSPKDFIITTNGDGVSFKWEQPNNSHLPIEYFGPEKYGDYGPLPPQTLRTVIKINTPWRVILPPGWKLLVLPIQYAEKQPFTTAVGILDTQISRHINPSIFWHNLNDTTLIKAGTPLCQFIPIKTEIPKLEIRKATDKELEYEKLLHATLGSSFSAIRPALMKKMSEKYFGKEKKCPFHK